MKNEKIRITEKETVQKNCPVIIGFPDAGLSGLIALSYILTKFKCKEVAHITSSYFLPMMTIHEGIPKFPVRIYYCEKEDKNFLAVISEVPIPFNASRLLGDALVEWFKKENVKEVIILGSIGSMSRVATFGKEELPKTFVAVSDEEIKENLKDKIEIIEEGVIVGTNSVIMEKCMENNIKTIMLIAESFLTFPDPEAAASLIKTLNKIFNLDIEIDTLLKEWNEIKNKAKELMDQTNKVMALMKKEELPMYR
ncbi:MAG: proteasome assembly chaperone family protein, partial [Candidatus Altarchaeaceae archaeon]